MITKIVGNIFWLLFTMFLTLCFVAGLIVASVLIATSGELILIALIVVFILGIAVFIFFAALSIQEIIETCRDIDKILKEKELEK